MQTNLTLKIMSYIVQQGATDMQTESIQNISHFIWDFDGTLFDTYPVIIENIRQALQSFGFDADPKELMDKLLETVDHALSFYAEKYHIDKNTLSAAYQLQNITSNKELMALPMEGVGFTAMRNKTGIPVVMPPKIPPAWFVSVFTTPFSS